ncbi:hypothetical protein [Pelagicoccus sp. SDUM812002]|uniref:hypothetical protein n=1 Tax=Pelagicoccus sp. SDUM812002 TaxID=3041266 RepID=UPI0031F31CC3
MAAGCSNKEAADQLAISPRSRRTRSRCGMGRGIDRPVRKGRWFSNSRSTRPRS